MVSPSLDARKANPIVPAVGGCLLPSELQPAAADIQQIRMIAFIVGVRTMNRLTVSMITQESEPEQRQNLPQTHSLRRLLLKLQCAALDRGLQQHVVPPPPSRPVDVGA
jgi:hypothetical protein